MKMNRRSFINATLAASGVALTDPRALLAQPARGKAKFRIGVTDWNLGQSAKPEAVALAAKIGFEAALDTYQDLTQAQYESLHDTGTAQGLRDPEHGFVIQSIGSSANPNFSDEGIEYYRFVR